jgi:MFS family permease
MAIPDAAKPELRYRGSMDPSSSSGAADRFPWAFVILLSLAQLVSWGSVFYGFALFMEPMMRDLGWTKPEITGVLSIGLIASGLGAVPAGRLIDRGYGRILMTGGSVSAATLFALWSLVDSYRSFVILWVLLGLTMSTVLYESGFAVLQRRLGPWARRGITVMSLLGGLASTVFIPLTHGLIEQFGWRAALLALAGFNLAICAPIHALVIPPQAPRRAVLREPTPSNARRVLRHPAFWGFVVTVVVQSILSTGLPFHLLPLFVERGLGLDAAVAAYALIGPAQVGARLTVGLAEGILGLKALGILVMVLGVLAQLVLPFAPPGSFAAIAAFALLYGASNGMMTILRALLPAELFGREDYGTILGMIAAPANLTRALGPVAFGALWAWWGNYNAVIALCIAMALASLAGFLFTLGASRPRPVAARNTLPL